MRSRSVHPAALEAQFGVSLDEARAVLGLEGPLPFTPGRPWAKDVAGIVAGVPSARRRAVLRAAAYVHGLIERGEGVVVPGDGWHVDDGTSAGMVPLGPFSGPSALVTPSRLDSMGVASQLEPCSHAYVVRVAWELRIVRWDGEIDRVRVEHRIEVEPADPGCADVRGHAWDVSNRDDKGSANGVCARCGLRCRVDRSRGHGVAAYIGRPESRSSAEGSW